jgi:flagellar biosynthesis protein FlhA
MNLTQGWVLLAFVVILGAIILPIPALLLDVLLALSITFSLTVLTLTAFIKEPLELSAFPSILLLGTLLRLSLNIAAARRILLYGHEGTSAAGHIIEGFGKFVVGGDVVVGLVVFLIFIVINFVVITRGAERISEVAARFTLDAMPGKQMSIDADLNAGLISEEEARRRRAQLEQEASFYGAMDGASKFIRGDAIAALIILFLSLVGGLIVGIVLKGMPFSDAVLYLYPANGGRRSCKSNTRFDAFHFCRYSGNKVLLQRSAGKCFASGVFQRAQGVPLFLCPPDVYRAHPGIS